MCFCWNISLALSRKFHTVCVCEGVSYCDVITATRKGQVCTSLLNREKNTEQLSFVHLFIAKKIEVMVVCKEFLFEIVITLISRCLAYYYCRRIRSLNIIFVGQVMDNYDVLVMQLHKLKSRLNSLIVTFKVVAWLANTHFRICVHTMYAQTEKNSP